MGEKYTELNDLLLGWPDATSAIMKHIETEEPAPSIYGWHFQEGWVKIHDEGNYSVTIFHKAYDPKRPGIEFLSIQADIIKDKLLAVQTVKRAPVESEKLEDVLRKRVNRSHESGGTGQ